MFPDLAYISSEASRRSGDWSLAPYAATSGLGGVYAITGMLTSIPFNAWIAIGSIVAPLILGLIKTFRGDEAAALKAELVGVRAELSGTQAALNAITRAEESFRNEASRLRGELERIRAERGGVVPGKSNDAPS